MDSLNQDTSADFNAVVGAAVPNTIVIAPVTAQAGSDVPALKPYSFAMVQRSSSSSIQTAVKSRTSSPNDVGGVRVSNRSGPNKAGRLRSSERALDIADVRLFALSPRAENEPRQKDDNKASGTRRPE